MPTASSADNCDHGWTLTKAWPGPTPLECLIHYSLKRETGDHLLAECC
jgi:hypothetical protein